MKFKLNRGKSIKFGDKEIPISKTDGWTDIPDDLLIDTLSDAVVQADLNQDDKTAPDYVKNRPFYTEPAPPYKELGSTYEDWISALGEGNAATTSLSFLVNGQIYKDIIPEEDVEATLYKYTYYMPDKENAVYYYRAFKPTGAHFYERLGGAEVDGVIISFEGLEETVHYLDPKYIKDMYYTEPYKWGDTFADWSSTVKNPNTISSEGKELTIKFNGIIYENIIPSYQDEHLLYRIASAEESSNIVVISVSSTSLWHDDGVSFLVSTEVVHKIPEKYYDKYEPFIFKMTFDNGKMTTNRTWDEVEKALDEGFTSKDFFMDGDSFFVIPCVGMSTTTGSNIITAYTFVFELSFRSFYTDSLTGLSPMPLMEDKKVTSISVIVERDGSTVEPLGGVVSYIYPTQIDIDENSSGNLVCSPSSAVSYCLDFLKMPTSLVECPLYYNGETYNFESASADSTSVYFSTIANGTYKRIKITKGTNGAADTVAIDKNIRLSVPERVSLKQYFTGTPSTDFDNMFDYTGQAVVFIQPADTGDRGEHYDRWDLSDVDFPITATYVKRINGSGIPDGYIRVSTSTGRLLEISGRLNFGSGWETPNEVFPESLVVKSSTTDSTKKFKITVDDSGTWSATEVTETTTG